MDVICAYLRMPPGDEDWHVRLAAQRVLTRHLVVHDEPSFWPGVRVDLSGASLDRFDATGCTLAGADFRNAQFGGRSVFDRAAFDQSIAFAGCRFGDDVSFAAASWNCRFAHFGGEVVFEGARFHGRASFGRATFAARVTFDLVEHPDNLRFDDARAATSALRSWPAGWREAAVDEGSVTVVRAGPVPDGG